MPYDRDNCACSFCPIHGPGNGSKWWKIKVCTDTARYYLAVKKNELAGKWMELGKNIWSQITQTQMDKCHVLSHTRIIVIRLRWLVSHGLCKQGSKVMCGKERHIVEHSEKRKWGGSVGGKVQAGKEAWRLGRCGCRMGRGLTFSSVKKPFEKQGIWKALPMCAVLTEEQVPSAWDQDPLQEEGTSAW